MLIRDFTTNWAETSWSAVDASVRPISTRAPLHEAVAAVRESAESLARWTLAAEEVEGAATVLRFVRTSRLFRFKDDVTVRLDRKADACLITAVSRSRIGKGDLGQNRRNLRVLLDAVRMRLER